MSSFPWEVIKDNLNKFFEAPHLFSALYRVHRGAYYKQGYQLSGSYSRLGSKFQEKFDQLPIELKRLILSKVWQSSKHFNVIKSRYKI